MDAEREGRLRKEPEETTVLPNHSTVSFDSLSLARLGIEFQNLALEGYVKAPRLSFHLENRTEIIVPGHLIMCFQKYSIELFGLSVCEHDRIFLQKLWWLRCHQAIESLGFVFLGFAAMS